jgi:hypothetical protein
VVTPPRRLATPINMHGDTGNEQTHCSISADIIVFSRPATTYHAQPNRARNVPRTQQLDVEH